MQVTDTIVGNDDIILVTGSNGFIGSKVVDTLLSCGHINLRCFVRPSSNLITLNKITGRFPRANIEICKGNLLSRADCQRVTQGVSVIYHLAAGRGEKSYPDAYLNTVVTTRNLLDAALDITNLKRFLCVTSFTVYSTIEMKRGDLIDEACAIEKQPQLRGEAYCYAKVRQDELVREYGQKYNIPYVIVRPGVVYGPGNKGITGRVGIGTFGIFIHLGGSNEIPLSYVNNCADAIILAGLKVRVDGEIFNIVDDRLPTAKQFLRAYKQNVEDFKSISFPFSLSYFLCYLWEKYSEWSEGQLPPAFNRKMCSSYWKGMQYSNNKLKALLGWQPRVGFKEAAMRNFEYQKEIGGLK